MTSASVWVSSGRAVEEPMRWIAQNAGEEGSIVVNKVKELESAQGYNAAKNKYENLVNSGVIDPTKVVRYALQNAASIAGLMLTTEALGRGSCPRRKTRRPLAARPPVACRVWKAWATTRLHTSREPGSLTRPGLFFVPGRVEGWRGAP